MDIVHGQQDNKVDRVLTSDGMNPLSMCAWVTCLSGEQGYNIPP